VAPNEPVFADLDSDDVPEYLVTVCDLGGAWVQAWRLDGTPYPVDEGTGMLATSLNLGVIGEPLIADFNGDSHPELVSQIGEIPPIGGSPGYRKERFLAWDYLGQPLEGWPLVVSSIPYSNRRARPFIGDIDGNGLVDLLSTSEDADLVFLNLPQSVYDSSTVQVPCWRKNRSLNNNSVIPGTFEAVAVNPTKLQTGVRADASIMVRFNKLIDPATVSNASVTLSVGEGPAVSGTVSIDATGLDMVIDPDEVFAPSDVVTFVIDEQVSALDGHSLLRPFESSFTVDPLLAYGCCGVYDSEGRTGNVDFDPDGFKDITDILMLARFALLGGEVPSCLAEGNIDGDPDCFTEISDILRLARFSLSGGEAPALCIPECE
jgi:hypothetical protein